MTETEIVLGTVVSRSSEGAIITLDGNDEPLQKPYKTMRCGHSLAEGDRVVIIKQSGTYIVCGKISSPQLKYYLDPLPTSATLADVITKVNQIGTILKSIDLTAEH